MHQSNIDTIIFDLGGVLIDWNPEYLYTKIFKNDPKKMDWFLSTVCTPEWNMEQDAGRTLQMGTELLIKEFPDYKKEISAFYDRWEEMLNGEITDTVLILNKLKNLHKVKLYALTNWSIETFPIALKRYDFLKQFEGIVISGEEKTRKPQPKIYKIALDRYKLSPEKCLFIDDSLDNVNGAKKLKINALHFTDPLQLRLDLMELGLI
ncbi:MAG: HAD family phosphatase [Flavobacteriales bacterium]|nr:HAD family phosphatase [Flavobacteriales bacterium]